MIPSKFDYLRVDSAAAAIAALTQYGSEAKLLAGGHSLLPLMKLRLANPEVLIDMGPIDDLRYIRDAGDQIAVGALTTFEDLTSTQLLSTAAPLLVAAAAKVGDPQVRTRGTIGGTLVHGDPAGDMPAVALAMRAELVIDGPSGSRVVAADDFFLGFLETAVAEDELLTEIRFPKMDGAGWSFQKFNRRAQDYAIVGIALVNGGGQCGVGLVNMASKPMRSEAVESAVRGGASYEDASEVAADGTEPSQDLNASADYRRHLARVLVGRALDEAASRKA